MSTYHQLTLEERCSIARLREAGQSIRQIAAALDREPSTVSRELKRNGAKVGYRPAYAQAQAAARRWHGSRLEREDALREAILDRLAAGWSPEQVSGRLRREVGQPVISHETIYRFVHAQLKRTNDRRWRHYLPRAKYKRGWRTKGGWPRSTGRSIHERPGQVASRCEAGHWEADAMLFSRPGHAVIVAHERTSRLTIAVRQRTMVITRRLEPDDDRAPDSSEFFGKAVIVLPGRHDGHPPAPAAFRSLDENLLSALGHVDGYQHGAGRRRGELGHGRSASKVLSRQPHFRYLLTGHGLP